MGTRSMEVEPGDAAIKLSSDGHFTAVLPPLAEGVQTEAMYFIQGLVFLLNNRDLSDELESLIAQAYEEGVTLN